MGIGPSATALPFGAPLYRAPDVLLGSQGFGPDLDMWSVGCLAAELHQRSPLFEVRVNCKKGCERLVFELQLDLLGAPSADGDTHKWLK